MGFYDFWPVLIEDQKYKATALFSLFGFFRYFGFNLAQKFCL